MLISITAPPLLPRLNVRVRGLQWALGVYCAVLGALMCVAPHQFVSPSFAALRPNLPLWGVIFLAAGSGLLLVGAVVPRRLLVVAAHLLAATALLILAVGVATTGAWTGTCNYAVLGLALALAPFLPTASDPYDGVRLDLFALAMALAGALTGLIILAFPGQFSAPAYDGARPHLLWHGVLFLGGGLALAAVQLWPRRPRIAEWGAHVLAASGFLAFFITVALPQRGITGMALYGGLGLLLALQPGLTPQVRRLDVTALQWRLALALAAATALPLVIVVALVTDQEERVATAQARLRQQRLAEAQAQDVSDYVDRYRSGLVALADELGALDLGPELQQAVLRTMASAYPDVFALVLYDTAGQPVATSRELPLSAAAGLPLFEQARQSGAPAVDLTTSRLDNLPRLAILAPVRAGDGSLRGVLLGTVQPPRLTALLTRDPQTAHTALYMVDGEGRAVVHADGDLAAQRADLSATLPVAMLLPDPRPQGAFDYQTSWGGQLVGYARVPGLGWTVVAEQPASVALAGVQGWRDLAFGVLLVVGAAAALAGALAAMRLAAPLRTLAHAVDAFALEGTAVPLPRSGIREVAQLAGAFGALRGRLAVRTADRARAEGRLRAQLDFTTAITNSLAEGVCAFDRLGRITFANPAAARLLGWRQDALIGQDVHRVLHGAHHAAHQRTPCPLLELLPPTAASYQGEDVFSRADGGSIAVGCSAAPIETAGDVTGVVLAFGDITARKQAEVALRTSEQRLQLALAAGRMGTWEWEVATNTVTWAPSLEAIHGLAAGSFGGTTEAFLALIHPDDRPAVERGIAEILARGTQFRVEYRACLADGRLVWVEGRAQMIRDAEGRPVRLLGVAVDVTERKQTEEAQALLAKTGALLTASLDYETTLVRVARLAVPDLADVCIVDLLEPDGRIRRVAVAHSAAADERAAGELQRRWPPHPDGTNAVARVLRSGEPELVPDIDDARWQAIAQSPEHLAVLRALGARSAMNVPLVARGRTLGALTFLSIGAGRRYGPADLALAEDIARRAALAVDNARLYREAREAVAVRDQFLVVAAHELKTPITSLRGFAQLKRRQLERTGELSATELRRAFQVIDQQAERLARLVARLLDVSRIEAGQLQLERAPVDLVPLLERVVATAQATTRQHTITLHAPPTLPALVDALRLEQVVANLIDNAIQYSPDGGAIDVELTVPHDGQVCLSVTDDGIGIAPEERERVFDRFYRASDAGYLGGLGLGLHVCRQIVELHGGTIAVEAPPRGGTRVVVQLPTATPEWFASAVREVS